MVRSWSFQTDGPPAKQTIPAELPKRADLLSFDSVTFRSTGTDDTALSFETNPVHDFVDGLACMIPQIGSVATDYSEEFARADSFMSTLLHTISNKSDNDANKSEKDTNKSDKYSDKYSGKYSDKYSDKYPDRYEVNHQFAQSKRLPIGASRGQLISFMKRKAKKLQGFARRGDADIFDVWNKSAPSPRSCERSNSSRQDQRNVEGKGFRSDKVPMSPASNRSRKSRHSRGSGRHQSEAEGRQAAKPKQGRPDFRKFLFLDTKESCESRLEGVSDLKYVTSIREGNDIWFASSERNTPSVPENGSLASRGCKNEQQNATLHAKGDILQRSTKPDVQHMKSPMISWPPKQEKKDDGSDKENDDESCGPKKGLTSPSQIENVNTKLKPPDKSPFSLIITAFSNLSKDDKSHDMIEVALSSDGHENERKETGRGNDEKGANVGPESLLHNIHDMNIGQYEQETSLFGVSSKADSCDCQELSISLTRSRPISTRRQSGCEFPSLITNTQDASPRKSASAVDTISPSSPPTKEFQIPFPQTTVNTVLDKPSHTSTFLDTPRQTSTFLDAPGQISSDSSASVESLTPSGSPKKSPRFKVALKSKLWGHNESKTSPQLEVQTVSSPTSEDIEVLHQESQPRTSGRKVLEQTKRVRKSFKKLKTGFKGLISRTLDGSRSPKKLETILETPEYATKREPEGLAPRNPMQDLEDPEPELIKYRMQQEPVDARSTWSESEGESTFSSHTDFNNEKYYVDDSNMYHFNETRSNESSTSSNKDSSSKDSSAGASLPSSTRQQRSNSLVVGSECSVGGRTRPTKILDMLGSKIGASNSISQVEKEPTVCSDNSNESFLIPDAEKAYRTLSRLRKDKKPRWKDAGSITSVSRKRWKDAGSISSSAVVAAPRGICGSGFKLQLVLEHSGKESKFTCM